MLSMVNSGHKANTDATLVSLFGFLLWVMVSILCFLKLVLSLAHKLSRLSPVLDLCHSSRKFLWCVSTDLQQFLRLLIAFELAKES